MGDFDFLDKIPGSKDLKAEVRDKATRYVMKKVEDEYERAEVLEMLGLVDE